jgi:hypothetical protein
MGEGGHNARSCVPWQVFAMENDLTKLLFQLVSPLHWRGLTPLLKRFSTAPRADK